MSWAYWEFSAGFGIYNPTTKTYNTSLVDALLNNEMPEPISIVATPLYVSNFSNGTDGWQLITQSGASGSLSASNNKLNVTITNGGTEAWHIQLIKNNIALVKDKIYRISFRASASTPRSINFYAGKASNPWNGYSGSSLFNISGEDNSFSSSFTMTSPTDLAARLVFDVGTSSTAVTITSITVEEITLNDNPDIPTTVEVANQMDVKYYPNPSHSFYTLSDLVYTNQPTNMMHLEESGVIIPYQLKQPC